MTRSSTSGAALAGTALALSALLLAGCGSDGGTAEELPTAGDITGDTSLPTGDEVTGEPSVSSS